MDSQFKTRLRNLSLGRKMLLLGSGLTAISVFLPWYSDMDRFNVGDTFLGITGPLYLTGFIILAAGLASFSIIMKQLMGRGETRLPMKEGSFHLFSSILSVAMLVLTNSVYFHPKFGISIADKSLGFGIIIAFAGTGAWLFASIASRNTRVGFAQSVSIDEPMMEFGMMEERKTNFQPMRERTIEDMMAEEEGYIHKTNEIL